jgi:hypothetical protein
MVIMSVSDPGIGTTPDIGAGDVGLHLLCFPESGA